MNEKIKAYYVANDIDEVLNYIDNLEQENARLKDKIEKATKYIEWQRDNPQYDNIWRNYECNELLKILREN